MSKAKQLTLSDIYQNCSDTFENDKYHFLTLLETYISLDELIPESFIIHFMNTTGRPRRYTLTSFLWALLIQRIFSIPTDTLLLTFLNYSKELREFCGFSKVPDSSKITRFKQDFLPDLQSFFDNLVDITEPICQQLNSELASMLAFDTSGIEAFVTENNPKYANQIIRQMKTYKKTLHPDNSFDPYKMAYHSMPTHAGSNPAIKQLYINGHFCYVYKFGLITNGLGIVRDISFYNKDFVEAHPELIIDQKTDSPDEDKSISDSKALFPVLIDFFKAHPLISPSIFLGDAAFDTIPTYSFLLNDCPFDKAYIPLNSRHKSKNVALSFDDAGIPLCPLDPALRMKSEGKDVRKNGVVRYKFVCPKIKRINNKRQCFCDTPCTDAKCGRMTYIYPGKDLRMYPGTFRGTKEWDDTYKIRAVVEKSINHFKDSFGLAGRRTQNEKTLHADLLLSGITQLITVIMANAISKPEYIRSLKPLIA